VTFGGLLHSNSMDCKLGVIKLQPFFAITVALREASLLQLVRVVAWTFNGEENVIVVTQAGGEYI